MTIGDGLGGEARLNGSLASTDLAMSKTAAASAHDNAKIDTQSSERQAGTTPAVLSSPRDGLRPTMLLKAAGTRPDPAVSVPSANVTRPLATATADPELDPPEMYWLLNTEEQAP